jgi:DNA repair protein RecN (Recombination protein N)
MLNHLHISNFAIVPTLDLDFRPGFTAITGETGAGKSILVDALGLLLGERSDAAWVRPGSERAELSAEFSLENNIDARDWLEEMELATGDTCLLRRTINPGGRSRAFINGSPVTVAQMQSLGQLLVEIHGQNEHMRLTRSAEQFRLLDGSGDYADTLDAVQTACAEWQQAKGELDALERDVAVSPAELEFLNFQLEELQQFDLSADALESLQTEHDRLAAGGSLLDALNFALEQLDPESSDDQDGVNSSLNSVLGNLRSFSALDRDISDACTMLQEAAVNCSEAVNSLRAARDRVDLSPARLENLSQTLGELHDLARKHHVRMEGLEKVMQTLSARIESASGSEQRRSRLQAELQECLERYRTLAKTLHEKRRVQATKLSQRVTALMSELGMAGGTFELVVTLDEQARPNPRGDDELQIQISANPGLPPGPLNKIASGGELSRISLAIKVAASNGGEAVTQIFDEVDAGIGGATANAVGRLMKRLAGSGQALCVTHLAQVAVCATHQLQVRKATGADTTNVDTRLLDDADRVDEIARMLSGNISEQSRAHAIELLSSGAAAS